MKFYVQFLCVGGYLKHSNDTAKLNTHQYTNYDIIEIYRNILSTTTSIFITMDYSIMISEKYIHFRKRQKHLAKTFFPPRKNNWNHDLWNYFSNYEFLRLCVPSFLQKLERNWNNSGCIKVDNFCKPVNL